MVNRRWMVVLLIGAGVCRGAMAEVAAELTVGLGYRADSLDWNIAGSGNGQNPNVRSELSWSQLRIPQAMLKLDLHNEGVHLFGGVDYGSVGAGVNQDSDYDSDNRTDEFSRTNNQADGTVADGSFGIGYRQLMPSMRGRTSYLMPMAGYSLHLQNLAMRDGNQTISSAGRTPLLGPIAGLDSRYEAQWRGPWWGIGIIEEDVARGVTLALDIKYHLVRYSAEADWNLRSDFAHPVSFKHRANGDGLSFSFNVTSRLSRNVSWLVGLDYGRWKTNYGVDTVYLAAGGIAQTRLNEVRWESLALNVGLLLR